MESCTSDRTKIFKVKENPAARMNVFVEMI